MSTISNSTLQDREAEAPAHSSVLRRELGIGDLVLAQLLVILVADYMGTAVKAGSSHVVFWLLAIITFFVPQALVVMHLSRVLPLEGGLYEWARMAFNDRIGFMVAWNLWLYAMIYVGLGGLLMVSFVSYAVPSANWIVSSKAVTLAALAGMVAFTTASAALGLRFGKWINNVGAAVFLITIAALIAAPFLNVWRGVLTDYHPLRLVAPPLSLFSVSVFSKMTFGALTGFEYVAVFAGECRNPSRHLPRSVWLSAPVVALVYILATSAILAFVPPNAEDVVAPIPQSLAAGFHAFHINQLVMPVGVAFLLFYYLATFCAFFTASTRLPMVAGWDHLLPGWFSRLHPRYKTPINSAFFIAACTFLVAALAMIGVRQQESYELLLTWSFSFYGIAYVALFAIPLFSSRQRGLRPALWVRIAAASGLVTTLLFLVLSIFPIVEVRNTFVYSVKVAAVVVAANLLGWMIYRVERKSMQF